MPPAAASPYPGQNRRPPPRRPPLLAPLPLPPFVSGAWPLLGHAVAFGRDWLAVLERGYREHGTTFALRLGPRRIAVIADPDDLAIYFAETDRSLRADLAYRFLVPIQGEMDMAAPPEAYRRQRPLVQEPFKAGRMAGYLAVMDRRTRRWCDGLGEEGCIDIVAELQALTRDIAGAALPGEDFPALVDARFWALFDDIAASLDPVLPPHWPLPKFRRRDRAKARLGELLRPILHRRRADPGHSDDILQQVIALAEACGEPATDAFLVNYVVGLLLGAHETTAAQAAWLIILLLRHPEHLAAVQAELNQCADPDAALDRDGLAALPALFRAVRETERLRPSAVFLLRVAVAEVIFRHHRVPAGWWVAAAGWLTHRLPSLYTDPERFDPGRFAPDRAEDKRHRFALIGFGGGVHKCAGMSFAMTEMTVIAARLLGQFDLSLETADTRLVYGHGAPRPSPTRVRYRRRGAAAGGESAP